MSEFSIYQGGCHCGAVRFEVRLNNYLAYDCNCSICRKKGFLHLIVPPEQFKLISGAEYLSIYSFIAVAKALRTEKRIMLVIE